MENTSSPLQLNASLRSPMTTASVSSSFPNPLRNSFTGPTPSPVPHDDQPSPNGPYMAAELIIAALSVVGNLMVCAAVGLNHKLRTVTNYFLVSLAVADVCVGAVAIPCAILTDVGVPRDNLPLCLVMLSVLIMLTQSSIFSLLAVAVERYVAIFMPFRYQVLMTPRHAVLVIIVTWLLAFLIGLVPLMGWHKTPPAGSSGHCFFVLVIDMSYMVYFNFFACVLAPLVVMFLIYARIFAVVKRQLRRIEAERGGGGGGGGRGAAAAGVKQEMKTASSLFLVLFLFTACWIPLHVINCFLLLCPGCPVPFELLLTTIILSHANSVINPFLYAYKMKAFRDAFKAILTCCRTPVRDFTAGSLFFRSSLSSARSALKPLSWAPLYSHLKSRSSRRLTKHAVWYQRSMRPSWGFSGSTVFLDTRI
ncbi:Adenosine receptor A2a [Merluccius polli]|uniref:Adenosine receptor A2a n=1 Tax=Merluccius polli TaxID=89951 RepID=A0AA47NN15_MERPO|nr:Adenosine receptor A2a [Merluccius polli]